MIEFRNIGLIGEKNMIETIAGILQKKIVLKVGIFLPSKKK